MPFPFSVTGAAPARVEGHPALGPGLLEDRAGAAGLDLGWRAPQHTDAGPGRRRAWFPETDGFTDTAIHDRRRLGAGAQLPGPAIIEDPEATIVVPPGMHANVSAQGHIVIDTGGTGGPAP